MQTTQLDTNWLNRLQTAAEDCMIDDYPSVRADGARTLNAMLTPVAVLELIALARKNIAT